MGTARVVLDKWLETIARRCLTGDTTGKGSGWVLERLRI